MPSDNPFKWRQFEPALILQCVRWYLRYALSYRDLKDMMRERGLCVDHTTIYRWVQRYAPEIDRRCRPFLRRTNDSYRIDETYVRVGGAWKYLYRGVDSNGETLDFLLRATRDREAAIAFFRKTLGAAHTTPPRVVTVDKNPAYPVAFEAVRHEGLVRPRSNLRQCKYLNNIIEQDHRFIKRRTRPMLGFKRFTHRNTIEAYYPGLYNSEFFDLLNRSEAQALYETTQSADPNLYAVRQSIVDLLNYFEVVALMVDRGIADEDIVRAFAGSAMMRWYSALAEFAAVYNERRAVCVWAPYYRLMEAWGADPTLCG